MAGINETCSFNQQCEEVVPQTECRNERCVCLYEMVAGLNEEGRVVCKGIWSLLPSLVEVLIVFYEASRGAAARGVTVKSTDCGFNPHSRR